MAEALSNSIQCLGNIPNTTTVYHHPHHRHRRDFSLLPFKSSQRSSVPLFNLRSSPSSSNWMVFSRGKRPNPHQSRPKISISAQLSTGARIGIGIGKAQRWWEKGLQPNMKEVKDGHDLVDSLVNAGDHLVVVHFFSPGCGGCKALHPKICQLAEMNPDVQFLEVNYETHKSMCYTLNVHVLPFFRFYRGAHGRLCSFSCTNATIKKFRDALAKYGADFCSLEPTKGLEEKELLALAANKDLSFNYTPKPKPEPEPEPPVVSPEQEEVLSEEITAQSERTLPLPLPRPSITALHSEQDTEKRTLISSGR